MPRPQLILFFGLLLAPGAAAQPVDSLRADSTGVHESLERVLDATPPSVATPRQVAEGLTFLAENPLDVNQASSAELSTIPQLSPTLAHRIVTYRAAHGPLSSIQTLVAVDGIDRPRLRALRPYLRAEPPSTDALSSVASVLRAVSSDLDVRVLQRATRELDPGRGFVDDSTHRTFPGSPVRLTTRIRVSHDRQFQAALTLDKDPGEALRWRPRSGTYGFDHVAGNVAARDLGPVETLIVGDYTAEYGQGLALWQGMSFGKGRDPVSPLVREGRGLVPFQSTSENRFLRGLAATVSVTPALSASAFVSRRHRDATLDSTGAGSRSRTVARTLSRGGLHRTRAERRGKDALGMTTVGGALEYRRASLHLGAAGYRSGFDRPLRPPDAPYRRFDLSGTRTAMGSVFGRLFLDEYTLFGEVARTAGGTYGGLVGGCLTDEAGVDALLLARRYPPSFHGLHNGAVGESGGTQNEVGVYAGLRLRVAQKWRVGVYVDQYRFPWLRFSVPRPSEGMDTRAMVEYDPRPWLSTYLQVRAERGTKGTDRRGPAGRRLAGLRSEARQSLRWHTEYSFREGVTLRTRVQLSRFAAENGSVSRGALLYQGLRVRPTETLRLDARLALFDTEGYESRIYAYEHDLLYSFSVPVLYGQGQRSYLLVQYEPTTALTLEAKYGITWYPHRETVGSGLNVTEGNRVRDLHLQIRWSL